MSKLNYIEKLLGSAEVAWLPVGEITQYEQPIKYRVETKNYDDKYKTPVLTAGKTFILGYTDEVDGIYQASGTPVIIFDDFTTANKWVDFDFKVKSAAMKIITSSDNAKFILKYVYYWMSTLSSDLIDGVHQCQWNSNYCNKKIPIPCPDDARNSLEIQSEIVRILDTFSSLNAELNAELTARKKQYNYYRDQLLTFSDNAVEWKTLGDVAQYSKTRISHDKLDKNNYVGVKNLLKNRAGKTFSNCVPTSGNLTEYHKGDILIGNIVPGLKKIWHADRIGGADSHVLVIHSTDKNVNSRYLYHVLADEKFFEYNMRYVKGTLPRGNKGKIMIYSIPIPKNKGEQERIVSILDKFDVLTNSIQEGLPREIELRQKQYEYYRNLLLNFPKPEEEKT